MNAKKLLALILPLSFMLAACNGDSSSLAQTPGTQAPDNSGGVPTENGGSTGGNDGAGETPNDNGGTSDKTSPALLATVPEQQRSTSNSSPLIVATFDEAIDAKSVTADSVSLVGPDGNIAVEVSVDGENVQLKPASELKRGQSYTATIRGTIADLAGNRIGDDYSWQFRVSDDLCADFYAADFELVEGKDATAPRGSFPKPVKGVRYADPAYGSCVVRATDHEAEGLPGFARNDYSRRQPFNADDSYFLIYTRDGNWQLYRTSDMTRIRQLSLGGGSVEPQWHPTNPDLLYMFPNNGGMTISTYNVRTDEKQVVADFRNVAAIAGHPGANSLTDVWPSAARAWTKSEGAPSADARYWGLQVETADFQSIGMITYDLETDTITGVFDFSSDGNGIGRPDHISMSPSGKYVVPSWNAPGMYCPSRSELGTRDNPCGLMAYTRDFSSAKGLTVRGPHSDIGLDANGRDVLVAGDYDSGWVEMWDLGTGEATRLWQIYENGNSTAMHISAKNYNKPGWVLVSTYAEKAPGWYARKIFAVEMTANPRILNIAHSYNSVETYFSETHAAVNRDFTRVLFNSNWNTADMLNIDAYMVVLPDTAVPYAD